MRIPPHYQYPSWQRFFAGAAIGAIISWGVFLFIFGVIQEKHRTIIDEQRTEIRKLEKNKEIYQEEYIKLNKQAQQKLTVQHIEVKLLNGEKYFFKDFMIKNIEDSISNDLSDLITKDIETVYSSQKLIERAIEKQIFKIDGKEYRLNITKFMLFTTLSIEVEISFVK